RHVEQAGLPGRDYSGTGRGSGRNPVVLYGRTSDQRWKNLLAGAPVRRIVRTRIYDELKRWLPLIGIVTLLVPRLFAQAGPAFNTTVPSQIMDQFRSERVQWTTNVFIYANTLSGLFAG